MKISYKILMNKVMKDTFLKLMFNILKNYMNFKMIYARKNENSKGLYLNLHKTEYVIHIRSLEQALNHVLILKSFNIKKWIWIMQFSEKLSKMCESIVILNLSQQKEELFSIWTKLSYYKIFTDYLLAAEMKKEKYLWINLPIYDFKY